MFTHNLDERLFAVLKLTIKLSA